VIPQWPGGDWCVYAEGVVGGRRRGDHAHDARPEIEPKRAIATVVDGVKGSVGGTVASGDHRPRRPPPEPLNVAFDRGIDRFEHFLQLSLGGEAPRVCIPGRHTRHGGNVVAVSRHRRQTRRLATRRFPDRAWSRAPDLRSGAPSPAGRPGRAVCTRMAAQAPVGGAGWLLAEPTRLPCHAELNSNAGEHLGSIR
jgi:hypothetical protein